MSAEVAQLREDAKKWKGKTERWCRRWNAAMDDLTATKGEVARLREALGMQRLHDERVTEYYRQHDLGLPPSEGWNKISYAHVAGARQEAKRLREAALSTPTERNAQAAMTIQQYMDAPDDDVVADAPPMQFRPEELQPCGHPREAIRTDPAMGKWTAHWCGWCEDVGREREGCAGICDELSVAWDSYTDIRTQAGRLYIAGKAVGGELCAAAIRNQEADNDV